MCKAIGDLAKRWVTLTAATAPKVPKAKIMGASTLGACLASVAWSSPERDKREGQDEPTRPVPAPYPLSAPWGGKPGQEGSEGNASLGCLLFPLWGWGVGAGWPRAPACPAHGCSMWAGKTAALLAQGNGWVQDCTHSTGSATATAHLGSPKILPRVSVGLLKASSLCWKASCQQEGPWGHPSDTAWTSTGDWLPSITSSSGSRDPCPTWLWLCGAVVVEEICVSSKQSANCKPQLSAACAGCLWGSHAAGSQWYPTKPHGCQWWAVCLMHSPYMGWGAAGWASLYAGQVTL